MILALGTHREARLCSMTCGWTERVWPWVSMEGWAHLQDWASALGLQKRFMPRKVL